MNFKEAKNSCLRVLNLYRQTQKETYQMPNDSKTTDQMLEEARVKERDRLAAEAQLKVLAEADAKDQEYHDHHMNDKAGFEFKAVKHGDFLAMFMTRTKGIPGRGDFEILEEVFSLNMRDVSSVEFEPGEAPQRNHTMNYTWHAADPKDEPTLNHLRIKEPRPARVQYEWPAVPSPRFYTGYQRRVSLGGDGLRYRVISGTPYYESCPLTTPNLPAPAEDDRVHFCNQHTLYVPFGLGRQTYDRIMIALGKTRKYKK